MPFKMTPYQKILIGYILIINFIAYFVMGYDKYQSKNKGQRISESSLFLLALFLGSLGIYLGMKAPIYHKAAKSKFRIGIPLLLILNVVVVWFLVWYKSSNFSVSSS